MGEILRGLGSKVLAGAVQSVARLGIVAVGAIIALSVLALSGISAWNLRESALADTEAGLRRLNLILAEQVDRSMQSIDLVITTVVKEVVESGIDSPEAYRAQRSDYATHLNLKQKLSGLPQLDAITMISAEGKLINFSRYWPIPQIDVTDRDYFVALRDHPEERVFWSKPVQNRGTGTWTTYMAQRVTGPGGQFIGLVLAAIELRYFEQFYRAVLPGPESAISLLRSDGALLARYPVAPDAIGKSFWDAPAFTEILRRTDSGTAKVVSPVDGVGRILSARRLRNYPLAVTVTQTEAAALAGWRSQAQLIALMTAAAVLAIVLLTSVVARRMRTFAMLAQARAELNQAVFARAKAEAVAEAKSHFVASISHELRTPLNAIMGFSEILKDEMLGPLGSDRYVGYAADIHTSGAHLLGIVNDILDLTKAEAGALRLHSEPLDIAALLDRIQHMLGGQAEKAGVELRTELEPGLPVISGDEQRLFQALINLASNAIKFTPEGGHVLVSVARHGDDLILAVRDDGIGIAPEDMPKAMEPFGQVDSGLARKYQGSGLGLPLTERLARLHGGALVLDSMPGKGTTAMIRLPIESPSG